MITFETQEDFENAVMEVVRKRLVLDSEKQSYYSLGNVLHESVELKLQDVRTYDYGCEFEEISSTIF